MNLIKTQISTGDGVDLFLLFSVGLATTKFAFFVRLTSVAALFVLRTRFFRGIGMYNNIGERLKILAVVEMVAMSLISVVFGVVSVRAEQIVFGVVTILIGPVLSWIASWIIYGIGEAAENSAYVMWWIQTNAMRGGNQRAQNQLGVKSPEEAENSYAMQNAREIASAVKVETDSHGEAVCPICRKTVTFDPPNCARKCNHCQAMLKPVRKSHEAAEDYHRIKESHSHNNETLFHGEEMSTLITREREREEVPETKDRFISKVLRTIDRFNGDPVKVIVNSHNECRCPVCKKEIVFDSSHCAQKCENCKTMLKPVNY